MLVDIEADREILRALYGSAKLPRLGIKDIPLAVPKEAARLRWSDEVPKGASGQKNQSALYPLVHGAEV